MFAATCCLDRLFVFTALSPHGSLVLLSKLSLPSRHLGFRCCHLASQELSWPSAKIQREQFVPADNNLWHVEINVIKWPWKVETDSMESTRRPTEDSFRHTAAEVVWDSRASARDTMSYGRIKPAGLHFSRQSICSTFAHTCFVLRKWKFFLFQRPHNTDAELEITQSYNP